MKPINEWVIVENIKDEEKSPAGIILSTVKKTSPFKRSKVVAISADVARYCADDKHDLQYAEGSIIYRHAQTGIPVAPDDKDNDKFFIKYDAVMAVE
jgi:co-chaperonin GroES (HSP10)